MGMCWAPDCKHYSLRNKCRFFRFPKYGSERNKWIELFGRGQPGPGAFICSCHFRDGKKENGPELLLPNGTEVIEAEVLEESTSPEMITIDLTSDSETVVKTESHSNLKRLLEGKDLVILDKPKFTWITSKKSTQQRPVLSKVTPQIVSTETCQKEPAAIEERFNEDFENCQSVQNSRNYVRCIKNARRCCVPHCPLRHRNSRGLKTFAFPTEFIRKQKWLHATNLIKSLNETLPDIEVKKLRPWLKILEDMQQVFEVCAAHFRETDFFKSGCKSLIKKTALPKLVPCASFKIPALTFTRQIETLSNYPKNGIQSRPNFTTKPSISKPNEQDSFKPSRPPSAHLLRIKNLQNRVQVVEDAIVAWKARHFRKVR